MAKYPGLPGLSVVDVSDPANPTEAGFLDIFKSPSSLDVAGNYAYVADRLDGLYVVDISDPARPAEVSFFAIYGAEKVATSPGFAYVTTGYCECDLQVVNLTDPEYPVAAGAAITKSQPEAGRRPVRQAWLFLTAMFIWPAVDCTS